MAPVLKMDLFESFLYLVSN